VSLTAIPKTAWQIPSPTSNVLEGLFTLPSSSISSSEHSCGLLALIILGGLLLSLGAHSSGDSPAKDQLLTCAFFPSNGTCASGGTPAEKIEFFVVNGCVDEAERVASKYGSHDAPECCEELGKVSFSAEFLRLWRKSAFFFAVAY
jgi:hypothetical protein